VGAPSITRFVPSTCRPPGQGVSGDVFLRDAGGKGLNQAVGAIRLDADAALIAAIGQDRGGDDVLRALEQNGIATDTHQQLAREPGFGER